MKKITTAQARIIAKKLNAFIIKHTAFWERDEKLTIGSTAQVIKNNPQQVYDWLFSFDITYGKETAKEADDILDMIRYPEYITDPLTTMGL